MELTHHGVNPRRPYNSARRRLQAEQNRSTIVEIARELFLRHGFAGTTINEIASASGFSVETIYKTFGGKGGLVQAIFERALAGRGPVPAEVRSDELQQTEADPRKIIEGWGRFVAEVAPLGSPILLLVRAAAASEPEMARLCERLDTQRLERMTANAQTLASRGFLRAGLSVADAADILWTYSSAELYELLVMKRSWPVERYSTFVAEAMKAVLLPDAWLTAPDGPAAG